MVSRKEKNILSTAGLIITDACIFHETIAKNYPGIRTLGQIRTENNVKLELEKEWEKIQSEINYIPVFSLAQNVLQTFPASSSDEINGLLNTAYDIASTEVLLKHDLMGRIYQELLLGDMANYYATNYTSIPAARLLSRLSTNLSEIDNNNITFNETGTKFRAIDFACGSGTLLSSLHKDLETQVRLSADDADVNEVHKYLLEEGLWGLDVLQHATHLAMTSLSLQNPSTKVNHSRIYTLPIGINGQNKSLGSLDFIPSSTDSAYVTLAGEEKGIQQRGIEDEQTVDLELPDFDLCLMNPPYTRSVGGNLLFGDLEYNERRKLQSRLKEILSEEGISGIGKGGLAGPFVYLAHKYIKPGKRIGMVLPKTALNGVSWQNIREFLINDYHIEFVISSFEPGNWCFSENTDLSEILMIIRKLKDGEESGYTYFLNLYDNPDTEIDSIFISTQLLNHYGNPKPADIGNGNAVSYKIQKKGSKLGELYTAKLSDSEFGHKAFFAQAELNRIASLLRQGTVYTPTEGTIDRVATTNFDEFIDDMGPDVSGVHKNFTKTQLNNKSLYQAFWNHDSDDVRSVYQESNKSLDPKDAEGARRLWDGSGKLLVAERGRLNTIRMTSVYCNKPVLSNMWWPIVPTQLEVKNGTISAEEFGKILSLWFNSTHGRILMGSVAQTTEGPWVKFKKGNLKPMPIYDFREISTEDAHDLIDTYEDIKNETFNPIPQEFAEPETISQVDRSLLDAFDIDVDMSSVYDLLANDPVISNSKL